MVKTPSTMVPLGTPAPEFSLLDAVSGEYISLNKQREALATVIMFICNHCPYVKHVNSQLSQLANDYLPKNVCFPAINSNDAEQYPDDSFENMKKKAQEQGYPFPYLYDETQEVALAYQAVCTPDFYIYDKNLLLVYRGQLDNSRPGQPILPDGNSIRTALDSLLSDKPVPKNQIPSIGCNIKWKK